LVYGCQGRVHAKEDEGHCGSGTAAPVPACQDEGMKHCVLVLVGRHRAALVSNQALRGCELPQDQELSPQVLETLPELLGCSLPFEFITVLAQ
jgi:hypothetical protein